MLREVKFESQDRRIKQILACLNAHGIASIEEANEICEKAGLDPYKTCEETQMICFENAKWAYVVGTAIALKEGAKDAVEAANYIGEGLRASASPAPSLTTAKSASDTANSVLVSFHPTPNASLSWLVTRASQLLKAPSKSHKWQTNPDPQTNPSAASSTVSEKTLPRSFPASTASLMCRPSSTTTQVSSKSCAKSPTATVRVQR